MSARRLAVFGASGHGKVVAEIAQALGWTVDAFLDDAPEGKVVLGVPARRWIPGEGPVALGIGNNRARRVVMDRIGGAVTLLHPSAVISPSCTVGEGTVAMARVVVNAEARIGRGVILNTGCVVEHDNVLGDFVHLSPGALLAGNVTVGDGSHVGIGACVRQGVRIGARVTVGAGAVVVRDLPDGVTVVGNPATRFL